MEVLFMSTPVFINIKIVVINKMSVHTARCTSWTCLLWKLEWLSNSWIQTGLKWYSMILITECFLVWNVQRDHNEMLILNPSLYYNWIAQVVEHWLVVRRRRFNSCSSYIHDPCLTFFVIYVYTSGTVKV